jgi:hypothetical protein
VTLHPLSQACVFIFTVHVGGGSLVVFLVPVFNSFGLELLAHMVILFIAFEEFLNFSTVAATLYTLNSYVQGF